MFSAKRLRNLPEINFLKRIISKYEESNQEWGKLSDKDKKRAERLFEDYILMEKAKAKRIADYNLEFYKKELKELEGEK